MRSYSKFLLEKSQIGETHGFEPIEIPECLFPFQRHATKWSIRQGRAGLFGGCGVGKTPMQLIWADNVLRHTNKPVIIFAPLAVTYQTEREAKKFGIDAKVSRDGKVYPITIANYERMHYFNNADFIGAAGDELSCIKAFDGRRRKQVIRFFSKLPYRLSCSATPSPNDFIELGVQSECLGIMTQSDMLGFFFRATKDMRHTLFKEGDFWNQTAWTFKPHSEQPFWRWVSSWARAFRVPSDLGNFNDDGFILPPLEYRQTVVDTRYIPPGELFPRQAITIREQKQERKLTIKERCEKVAELVNGKDQAIVWCDLNEEGTTLAKLIPDAVEVAGRHGDDYKEEKLNDFAIGNFRVLITKAKIGCWGMNYQNCHHMSFFPTWSYEQFEQGIARCWRFGQKHNVLVDIVSSPGEEHVISGLERKRKQRERMFAMLVKYMDNSMAMHSEDGHIKELVLPEWNVQREEGSEPLIKPIVDNRSSDMMIKESTRGNRQYPMPTRADKMTHDQRTTMPKWLGKNGDTTKCQ